MVLADTTCVYAYHSNLCPPFRLTYDYSVSPVFSSIALERVLSLIPPLRIPYHCHLQPYHLSRRHLPNHQQAVGNGFRSCVFVLPNAKGLPNLSVQTALASPATLRYMRVAVGSEDIKLLSTLNLSVHPP